MRDNDTGNLLPIGGGNGDNAAHRPPHEARSMGEGKQMVMGERMNTRPRMEPIQPRHMLDNDRWRLEMVYAEASRAHVEGEYRGDAYRKIEREGQIWVYRRDGRNRNGKEI